MSADITANGGPKTTAPPPQQTLADENEMPQNIKAAHPILIVALVLIFVVLIAGMFVIGWIPSQHSKEEAASDARAESSGIPIVIVALPRLAQTTQDIHLPCELRANQETAIYARTAGYLQSFTHDIGSLVEEGDILARIDSPEIDAQLLQSQAALKQAQANRLKAVADLDYANRSLDRYTKVQAQSGTVGAQELDDRQSAADQAKAAMEVADANVSSADASLKRLVVLQGFEVIKAPFRGIITARSYDVGALIAAGSSAGSRPLFNIAQIDTLRAMINVPQVFASQIADGQPAIVSVRNFPGVEFKGTVARNARAINASSRTILFEIDIPNADAKHALFPGMYGSAMLHITQERPSLVIDSSALVFNAQGSQVAILHNDTIHFQPISVDRDLGPELEVTGLSPNDRVVINPGQRLAEGTKVEARDREPKPGAELTTNTN